MWGRRGHRPLGAPLGRRYRESVPVQRGSRKTARPRRAADPLPQSYAGTEPSAGRWPRTGVPGATLLPEPDVHDHSPASAGQPRRLQFSFQCLNQSPPPRGSPLRSQQNPLGPSGQVRAVFPSCEHSRLCVPRPLPNRRSPSLAPKVPSSFARHDPLYRRPDSPWPVSHRHAAQRPGLSVYFLTRVK